MAKFSVGSTVIDETELVTAVEQAAQSVAKNQSEILKNGHVERGFTHFFVNEIAKLIQIDGIMVDPFYNKHRGATKMLDGRVIELDIAIHERNIDDNNLVAIELETSNYPKKDDLWKVDKLTQELHGYGYRLGFHIVFGVGQKAGQIISKEWFKRR